MKEGDRPEVQNLDYSINLNLEQGYEVVFLLFTKVQYALTTEFERIKGMFAGGLLGDGEIPSTYGTSPNGCAKMARRPNMNPFWGVDRYISALSVLDSLQLPLS